MHEQLILVDPRNRRIGTADKRTVHEKGLRHRAFSIFLVDSASGILLQRRQLSKYHSGGLWSNSCCGHPRPGEQTIRAAQRRLREELGATTGLVFGFLAQYHAEFANGLRENEIVSVYFGRVPRAIAPNPDEIAGIEACSLQALQERIVREPDRYSYWLRYYVTHHFAELTEGIRMLARPTPGADAQPERCSGRTVSLLNRIR